MSLLNQVLRDLDHRHAAGAPATAKPAVARSVKPSGGQRALRWALGAGATLAAVVAGGWAQGSLQWPAGTKAPEAVAVAAPVAVKPLTVEPHAPTHAPTPVAAAPVVATPVAADPSPAVPSAPEPARVAIAAPSVRRDATPSAAARPQAPDAPAPVAKTAEPRIELRSPARTPQERAEAHYQRGVTAHQAGQIDDSVAAFAAALREDPRHAGARVAQAGVLIGQGRHDDALVVLKDGLALTPAQPQLALMLARMHADRHDWATAAGTLQSASAHAATDAEFQGFHAAILQRAGRHAEAVEKYGLALRLAPNRGVWWMGLAISLEEIGQAESARTAFQRARAIGLPEGAAGYVDARLRQLG